MKNYAFAHKESLMFRTMRRIDRAVSEKEAWDIVKKGDWGTLSLIGDEGYPYGVPLNYIVEDGKLYFHSGAKGHKLDAMKASSKACFTIVTKAQVIQDKVTTAYESVILFGNVRIIEDPAITRSFIVKMAYGFGPITDSSRIDKALVPGACPAVVMEFIPDHIQGKATKY